ncbi:zinc ABC transporter substrate-binding protein [Tritonibacter multivorans]|uniref:zinc ABC transporter substrate-binding protein n=1 Tax=Tritonibacter multivorans TaxID=928856 RepID=UPI0008E49397|nr:zinc ABC transporter substrate-binding protein [Tritonibacter multivorans]SFD64452.1 zinc transport system substrate-binding protein [Tritonibacter multivorans]
MIRASLLSGAAAIALASAAQADAPRVVTDIAPVHGLVARVMQGVGEPELLVPAGASPHSYALKPSQAGALSQADAVFWVGHELVPWLEGSLETLAVDAHVTELLDAPGTKTFEFREGATFEGHDHHDDHGHDDHDEHAHGDHGHDDHDEHAHDDHGHDDHDEHAHDDHGHDDHDEHAHDDHGHDDHDEHAHDDHGHDDHDEHAHDDHEGHDHDGVDPHAWLAPENGKAWLSAIAEELSEIDPANAEIYTSNAIEGQAEIDAMVDALQADLGPVRDNHFVVFHDAYQYFEQAFDLAAAGSISLGDAAAPSAARIAEIQDVVKDLEVTCVFSEPQYNPGLVATVLDGTNAKTAVIDPLGTEIPQGPSFYTALLTDLGQRMAACLTK